MNSPNEPVVQATDLVRKFGDRAVIDHLSFEIQRGETLVIMGGSGCGKSTLLRHIIGVMKPTSGSVKIFGEEITGMSERELDKVRRRFGMLFQSGALLASLTVGENVALPLIQHTELSAAEIDDVVRQKLKIVGLTGFETLKPDEIRASPIAVVQQFINGEPDGPRPLNLSTGDHRQLAHVRPRPFVGARGRFNRKTR